MPNFVIKPAVRTDHITYAVRDIVVLANQVAKTGKEMLYLNIGDPNQYDWVTPKHLVDATCNAMKENLNGYAPSSGIKEAIDAIAIDSEKKSIKNIQDIFITTGASEAIEICLTALVNDGENILTPSPGYPLYTAIQSKLQTMENPYYLDESNGWQPDIEDIKRKINSKTRGIIILNPNNPTGSVCQLETLKQIVEIALEHNLVIFADEIYDKLLLDDEKHISIASLDSQIPVVTFSGLSKNYLVPGFRIGWGIVTGNNEVVVDYIEAINKILRARLCANHPGQWGIAPSLLGDQSHLLEAKDKLTRRRNMTVEMLNAIPGISCVKPVGAFYAYPKIENIDDDVDWSVQLMKETGVVVVPGSGFGQLPGTHHVRIVFLPPEETLEKAYKAIAQFHSRYMNRI